MSTSVFTFALAWFWLGLIASTESAFAATVPRTQWRVLFLGDTGHHQPAERFKQLQPVLARHGIELVYTERLDDLRNAPQEAYMEHQERVSAARDELERMADDLSASLF